LKIKNLHYHLVTKQLEEDKTWQLLQYNLSEWNDVRFKDVPRIKVQNPFISEWGLIPQTKLKPLKEILQHLFNIESLPDVSIDNIQKSVDHISKIKQVSVHLIVITKVMPRAVEHDISRIIGKESATYKVIDRSGINARALEKFNMLTIRTTDAWNFNTAIYEKEIKSIGKPKNKKQENSTDITAIQPSTRSVDQNSLEKERTSANAADNDDQSSEDDLENESIVGKPFDVQISKPTNASLTYHIIETIDNITFRILTARMVGSDNYTVQASSILTLLRFITENTVETSRITEYNKTLELAMYKNMRLTPKIPLQDIASQSAQKIDIGIIRQRLTQYLMAVYDKQSSSMLREITNLRELIFSSELTQQFINAQITIYMEDKSYFKLITDPSLKKKSFNQNSILITFLLHANDAIRKFQREMNDIFREVINKFEAGEINGWSYDKRQTQFRIIFGKIVDTAIKRIFTSDNNVYQNVRYKIDILNAM